MIEKLAATFAAVLATTLAIWSRITFVRRSEIYAKDGQPIYQHAVKCKEMQESCNKMVCKKIDELKAAQALGEEKRDNARDEMQKELGKIKTFVGRVEQFMKDHNHNF